MKKRNEKWLVWCMRHFPNVFPWAWKLVAPNWKIGADDKNKKQQQNFRIELTIVMCMAITPFGVVFRDICGGAGKNDNGKATSPTLNSSHRRQYVHCGSFTFHYMSFIFFWSHFSATTATHLTTWGMCMGINEETKEGVRCLFIK